MKKFIYSFLAVSVIAVLAMSGNVKAANETAITDGNVTNSLLGTFQTSTGTSRQGETARLTVDKTGALMTTTGWSEMVISTGRGTSGGYTYGTTTNTFSVNLSSWIGAVGCRGFQDNCNVIKLARTDLPIRLDKINIGAVAGGNFVQVRLFDSRGSTDMAFKKWEVWAATATTFDVGMTFSSGTVAMIDGNGYVGFKFDKQNR